MTEGTQPTLPPILTEQHREWNLLFDVDAWEHQVEVVRRDGRKQVYSGADAERFVLRSQGLNNPAIDLVMKNREEQGIPAEPTFDAEAESEGLKQSAMAAWSEYNDKLAAYLRSLDRNCTCFYPERAKIELLVAHLLELAYHLADDDEGQVPHHIFNVFGTLNECLNSLMLDKVFAGERHTASDGGAS